MLTPEEKRELEKMLDEMDDKRKTADDTVAMFTAPVKHARKRYDE